MLDSSSSKSWFVSSKWLVDNITDSTVKVIDGTWSIPGSKNTLPKGIIPDAHFIDLGKWKSETDLGAPFHPSTLIVKDLSNFGINSNDHIIVYDRQGYFSAPRIAWSLKGVGHEKVSVLRGGLPTWLSEAQNIATNYSAPKTSTNYVCKKSLVKAASIDDVLNAASNGIQILDARPSERFCGHVEEPRPGLKSGHIPQSLNLPLGTLKDGQGQLLDKSSLKTAFESAGVDFSKPIITTCGSGVTAAALAWILYDIGKYDVAVYSGSWAEYGASGHPVEKS